MFGNVLDARLLMKIIMMNVIADFPIDLKRRKQKIRKKEMK
jgi:hypothetical protein